jgi:hypothetical protein
MKIVFEEGVPLTKVAYEAKVDYNLEDIVANEKVSR